jgi:MFS family permease
VSPTVPSVPRDWRVPLFLGVASIPFSLVSYLQSDSTMSLWPVVIAGLIAGYLTDNADRVGARTGFVGGLAVFWIVAEMVLLVPELTGPWWFLVAASVGSVVFAVLGVALSILLGALGAYVGGWLARRTGRSRPTAGA